MTATDERTRTVANSAPKNGGNGKNIAALGLVMAFSLGLAKLGNQQMDALRNDIAEIRKAMDRADDREKEGQKKVSEIDTRFEEVETQLKGVREIHAIDVRRLDAWARTRQETETELAKLRQERSDIEHAGLQQRIEWQEAMAELTTRLAVLEMVAE
jgi:chromosome segregation ATPase